MANENVYVVSGSANMYEDTLISGNGYYGVGYTTVFGSVVKGALRFTGVAVPQGTSVNHAELGMWMSSKYGTETVKAKIMGIDEDNTAELNSGVFGRPMTSAQQTSDLNGDEVIILILM
ncbi:hypothetical protein THIOSC15_1840004 [uncultured Thiomicrorhabdus sp.]